MCAHHSIATLSKRHKLLRAVLVVIRAVTTLMDAQHSLHGSRLFGGLGHHHYCYVRRRSRSIP